MGLFEKYCSFILGEHSNGEANKSHDEVDDGHDGKIVEHNIGDLPTRQINYNEIGVMMFVVPIQQYHHK
jgi:hypothetical protein